MTTKQITEVPISSITIGSRYRKDMGDLNALADSIEEIGLLQPVGIDANRSLVFGCRRIAAFRDILKRSEIPCVVVDLKSIVAGEYAENEIRKNFTLSERDSIRRVIEADEKAAAKKRMKLSEGRGKKGPPNWADLKPDTGEALPHNCTEAINHRGESRETAAKRAGLRSHSNARRVAKVVDNGSPELIKAMDDGLVTVYAATVILDIEKNDPPKAKQIISDSKKGGRLRLHAEKPVMKTPLSSGKDPIRSGNDFVCEREPPTKRHYQEALKLASKMNRIVSAKEFAGLVVKDSGGKVSEATALNNVHMLAYGSGYTVVLCKGGLYVKSASSLDAEGLLDKVKEIKRRCIVAREALVCGNSVNFDFNTARETIEFVLTQLEGV